MKLIGGGGIKPAMIFGVINLPCMGKNVLTKIESCSGLDKWLVRDLSIKESLQMEIKPKMSNRNKSYAKWCNIPDKEILNKVNSLLHHIWGGIR